MIDWRTRENHKKRFYDTNLSLVFSSQSYKDTILRKMRIFYNFHVSFKFLHQSYVSAGPGQLFSEPAHVTAFTTVFFGIARAGPNGHMIKVLQPLSQPSKDVGRFHVAGSQPQVPVTGQQVTFNNPRTFCQEKGT